MANGRNNVAEHLGDVLELIQARRSTGLLSLEHYESGRFEEGELYFQKGKLVSAHYAHFAHQDALTKLMSWRNIFFSFTADVSPPSPSVTEDRRSTTTAPWHNTTTPIPAPPTPPTGEMRALPRHTDQPRNTPPVTPRWPSRTTGNIYPTPSIRSGTAARDSETGALYIGLNTQGIEALIPRRKSEQHDVLSLSLTRPQRSTYLLVDGTRTIADIARCTNKSVGDVAQLLSELQKQRLVEF